MSDLGIVKSCMNLNANHPKKWRPTTVQISAVGIIFVHLLVVFAPFAFTWPAFWVAVGLSVVGQLFGLSLSYHRNLSHQSFKIPKWLEYFFAYCGALLGQGDPIFWVSIHRYHHQFVDTKRDPHSPIHGFWYSHMGWIFSETHKDRKNVEDLKMQPFYLFLRKTYCWHLLAHAFVLYALGGFPFLIWGEGVRMFYNFHATFLVNSVCHLWGKQMWNTDDLSKNNGFMAWLTFGEGWHNNHHAFEFSARHGLEWWQFDPAWFVIRFLEAIGLATNVKLPTEAQKHKKSF